MMALIALGVIFTIMLVLLGMKRPLYQAILGGLLVTVICFGISPSRWWGLTTGVLTTWSSLSILLSLYLITFLQRILEETQVIKKAERDLDAIFHNRRVTAMGAPLFIGLLPSAAAMVLCGDIVKSSTQGYLKLKDQAFVTTWIRHIPESVLPTYPAILLMSSLAGVPLGSFMVGMLPIVAFLLVVVYWRFIRHIPKQVTGDGRKKQNWKALLDLFKHLWSLIVLLILIIALGWDVVSASLVTIVLSLLIYRISPSQIRLFVRTAFEGRLLGNMFLVLVFKQFLEATEVLKVLPLILQGLPIPTFLVFTLLFFLGGIVSGASGIIALGTPIAFAALPNGGLPLMILLMATTHAASQISPTHVCLTVVSDYYGSSLLGLMRQTLPYSLATIAFAIAYYGLMSML